MVTTGPGGTNAVTGVAGAWLDSTPVLFISGQVKRPDLKGNSGVRQVGLQEVDIVSIVSPITKYAVIVMDPNQIRFILEKAFHEALNGRPGPVWIDIPLDVQNAKIDPDDLIGFNQQEIDEPWRATDLDQAAYEILLRLKTAKRPVIFAGGGVRLSGKHKDFIELINKLGVPVVSGWNAHDVIWEEHPLNCGRPGSIGDRAGNFTVQNSDLLIVLGSRLNIRQISYNWKSFARDAFKIWVDIDEQELKKPSVHADIAIHANLADLLPILAQASYEGPSSAQQTWLAWCRKRAARYPVVLEDYWRRPEINPYCFMQTLFERLNEDQIVVTGNGSACVVSFQTAKLKKGQRLWTNSGCASMGYDLPAAIGVANAAPGKQIVCLAGDGSIMMNLQELQTIAGYNLPIKIFILNNNGYSSIFQTHRNFFNGVEVGAGPKSGVSFPSFEKLARGFEIEYMSCASHHDMPVTIEAVMLTDGPVICEVLLDPDQPFAPKLGAKQHPDGRITSPPLEDLSPFLSREELLDNLLIPPVDE
jgi:acetolactate synthase-1/2/3 large subunit